MYAVLGAVIGALSDHSERLSEGVRCSRWNKILDEGKSFSKLHDCLIVYLCRKPRAILICASVNQFQSGRTWVWIAGKGKVREGDMPSKALGFAVTGDAEELKDFEGTVY